MYIRHDVACDCCGVESANLIVLLANYAFECPYFCFVCISKAYEMLKEAETFNK